MIANTEQTDTAPASVAAEPKATQKASAGKRGANVAPKRAKSGKKASPTKKAPQGRKERRFRRRRQQGSHDPGTAEAAARSDVEGTDESHRLAAAFGAWLPVWDDSQEDGSRRHFRKGRGRRAQLLDQSLKPTEECSFAPPDSAPAAFFVLEYAKLGRPVGKRQAQPGHIGTAGEQFRFDIRDLPAAALDSWRFLPLLHNLAERASVTIERRFLSG
jgi:hypothetical protein